MQAKYLFIFLILLLSPSSIAQRQVISFNTDWKFYLQQKSQDTIPENSDLVWKSVKIPHDWAHEMGISRDGAQQDRGGYFGGGIGWYSKEFDLSDTDPDLEKVILEFDGVYMNSEVWINGQYLGKRPYGYISFRYDISPYLKPKNNQLILRVDNSLEPSARWYHPCGIYAPVRLIKSQNMRIAANGIQLNTSEVKADQATLTIAMKLEADQLPKKLSYEHKVYDQSDQLVAEYKQSASTKKQGEIIVRDQITLLEPRLWSPDQPHLYRVESRVYSKKELIDQVSTSFGVRTISWEVETGFHLNGKQTKLLGVCEHYEGGPVGGAWPRPLLKWKLMKLKDMGVNAVRTAHNPAPPMFYELCDELGIMVMDEIFDGWSKKAPEDYGKQAFDDWWEKDLSEWIERNRNHPSIIIYSLGNETKGDIAAQLVAKCHELDPSRLVTSGHSGSDFMDVFGVNGHSEKMSFYENPEEHLKNKPFIATEAPHTWQTRGYYRTSTWFRDGYPHPRQDPFPLEDLAEEEVFHYEWAPVSKWANQKQHFNSSYDNAMVRISARKNWELMRDLPWFSGHFRWTGFDYYGEAGYVHGGWPFRLFMGGALDVAGFEKDLFYFYQSQWTKEPMTHILPHWTHPTVEEGTEIPVWVYSNCDEVELFFNGKSLGKDRPGTQWDQMQCEWMVPYQEGTLTAKGYIDGKLVSETHQSTAKTPSRLGLKLDTKQLDPAEDKIAIVTASTEDQNGVVYPYGETKVFYKLLGDARILALENGDPVDTSLNVGIMEKKAFMGLTNAFIEMEDADKAVNLIAGSILGEKQLISSNKISIDVQFLNLLGNSSDPMFSIYYTTDGSTPSRSGKQYMESFEVENKTTVRAIVYEGEEIVLTMEEYFAKDQGLYFGQKESMQAASLSGMPATEAEYKGASPSTDQDGNGYLDFGGQEGYIKWYQENDGSRGEYSLIIRYASNDPKSTRPMGLYINGKKRQTLNFPSTGHWSKEWGTVELKEVLEAGANYIELRTEGQSAANILGLTVN